MEKKNNRAFISSAQLGTPEITDKTTLGELLSILNLTGSSRKPGNAPTGKKLRETAGTPIAVGYGCEVYSNGWAVYDNGTGRTVIWMPKCTGFTYHFGELKPYEKEYLKQVSKLESGFLEGQSWVLAVTLIGEYRIEANLMNRTGSRSGTRVYGSIDEEGNDTGDIEEIAYSKGCRINNCSLGVDPLDAFAEKEYMEHLMSCLTEKQREVIVLYYHDGYTQQQIGELLGISRDSVADRLESAINRMKKIPVNNR